MVTAKCRGVGEKERVKMSRRAWLRERKAEAAEGNVTESFTPLVAE